MGLSGAEKRRKRKGGNLHGGPGQRGRFQQPIRSRRGYLAPFVTELHALAQRRQKAETECP